MTKLVIALILAAVICCSAAKSLHQKTFFKRRILARQQLEPTPTGYPPAGVTPVVPFDLPTETQEPDTVYGPPEAEPDVINGPPEQPDSVYGPPTVSTEEVQPDIVYEPPIQAANDPQPDTVYGSPDNEAPQPDIDNATEFPEEEEEVEQEPEDVDDAEEEVLLNDDGTVIAISTTFDKSNVDAKPARLVYQRFPQRRQPPTSVPARLRLARIRQPTTLYTP
uniref:DUF4794 domain-containing protein n=1 Tax=Stomoxys calcitrans TaxID=35570 RepID=A0A1I8NN09_STOCA